MKKQNLVFRDLYSKKIADKVRQISNKSSSPSDKYLTIQNYCLMTFGVLTLIGIGVVNFSKSEIDWEKARTEFVLQKKELSISDPQNLEKITFVKNSTNLLRLIEQTENLIESKKRTIFNNQSVNDSFSFLYDNNLMLMVVNKPELWNEYKIEEAQKRKADNKLLELLKENLLYTKEVVKNLSEDNKEGLSVQYNEISSIIKELNSINGINNLEDNLYNQIEQLKGFNVLLVEDIYQSQKEKLFDLEETKKDMLTKLRFEISLLKQNLKSKENAQEINGYVVFGKIFPNENLALESINVMEALLSHQIEKDLEKVKEFLSQNLTYEDVNDFLSLIKDTNQRTILKKDLYANAVNPLLLSIVFEKILAKEDRLALMEKEKSKGELKDTEYAEKEALYKINNAKQITPYSKIFYEMRQQANKLYAPDEDGIYVQIYQLENENLKNNLN